MSITTTLPPVPQTSDPTNFSAKADAFVAALSLFQTELNAYAAGLSPLGRNMLINGAFQIDQRNAGASAAIANDTYCFDRWNALTQTGTVASSQIADPEDGYTHAGRLTQSQATAQRFGVSQIIEGKNCKHVRGGSGTLTPRVRCSVSTPIRYAILGWSGTEDVVTSDVVNAWTNGTFTAGQFFKSTTQTVISVGVVTPSANAWTTLTALSAALGSAFNNIIIMVWTETAQAQNVTLDFDYIQFEAGAAATPFERRHISVELANCQRYFQSRSWAAGEYVAIIASIAASNAQGKLYDIGTTMRAPPTPTLAAGGLVGYNAAQSANAAITAATLAASLYGGVYCTSSTVAGGVTWSAGQAVLLAAAAGGLTITLNAEL